MGLPSSFVRLLCGAAVAVSVNYMLEYWLDDSGLHALLVTGRSAHEPTPAGRAAHVSEARAVADLLQSHALRLDSQRGRAADDQVVSVLLVEAHGTTSAQPPAGLASLLAGDDVRRLRTVWPERSRWRQRRALPASKDELPALGEADLLAQHSELSVRPEEAAAFQHAWTDLGYNALSEPGVVRCDLLREEARPHVFLARKVFRDAAALAEHERSPHFARWREATRGALGAGPAPATLHDTLHPENYVHPFRSSWAS